MIATLRRPPKAKAKPKAKPKSRWVGIKAAASRTPLPQPGTYRLRVIDFDEGASEPGKTYIGCDFEIVAVEKGDQQVGDTVRFFQMTGGTSAAPGLARVKRAVMAVAGYDDEDEFDEVDPDGTVILEPVISDSAAAGRLVDAIVVLGKPTADGTDYFREWTWAPVPEEKQDADSEEHGP